MLGLDARIQNANDIAFVHDLAGDLYGACSFMNTRELRAIQDKALHGAGIQGIGKEVIRGPVVMKLKIKAPGKGSTAFSKRLVRRDGY